VCGQSAIFLVGEPRMTWRSSLSRSNACARTQAIEDHGWLECWRPIVPELWIVEIAYPMTADLFEQIGPSRGNYERDRCPGTVRAAWAAPQQAPRRSMAPGAVRFPDWTRRRSAVLSEHDWRLPSDTVLSEPTWHTPRSTVRLASPCTHWPVYSRFPTSQTPASARTCAWWPMPA
jgi:hypothetical protein